jgi:hypothetical protein
MHVRGIPCSMLRQEEHGDIALCSVSAARFCVATWACLAAASPAAGAPSPGSPAPHFAGGWAYVKGRCYL